MSKGFSVENIPTLPPDALFGLKSRCQADTRENKVDLGIGAYRDDSGKPWILPVVKKVESLLINEPNYNHEYLAISGLNTFTSGAAKVLLGDDSPVISENRISSTQTLSGTGALHVAGLFIKNFYKSSSPSSTEEKPTIYLSKPTWGNHIQIFEFIGYNVEFYPYWNDETKSLEFEKLIDCINSAPKNSIFLLHSCAHNPTGLDPSKEQWKSILESLDSNNHLPLFDSAYQGFASGSLEDDAYAIRLAANSKNYKFPLVICQSFAKNVGMYGERVGAVHVVLPQTNIELNKAISSQLNKIIRSEISNPPSYGAKIVSKIINDKSLMNEWQENMIEMSSRIKKMRLKLRDELNRLETPGNWDHIVNQVGMFSFTGLKPKQVEILEKEFGIYMVSTGRISIAGLNDNNVTYVAESINKVVSEIPTHI